MKLIKLTILLLFFLFSAKVASDVYPVAGRRKKLLFSFAFSFLVFFGSLAFILPAYGSITIRPMLNTGMVGYWSMDEGSGTMANDQSGNRNTGTVKDLVVTDNFNRADANPIGGNWTTVTGREALQIVSNQVLGSGGSDAVGFWNANSFGADQYSSVKLTSGSFTAVAGAAVRISASGNTLYLFYQQTNTTMRMYRIVDGVSTQLGSDYPIAYAQNNVVKLVVQGTTLTPYVNGVAYDSQTDSQISGGYAGIWTRASQTVDDWEGGNVVAPAWVDGKLGKALDFDGISEHVDAGDPASLDMGLSDMTISAWINPSSSGTFDDQIVNKRSGVFSAGYDFRYDHGAQAVYGRACSAGTGTNSAASSVPRDAWTHVAVSFDRDGYMTMYVNGAVSGTPVDISGCSGESQSNVDPFSIGCRVVGGVCDAKTFLGKIDEARVYNRVLTAEEIRRLYLATRPNIVAPNDTGLVGYWSMEEGAGTNVGDSSGNGNDGTLSGSTLPSWTDGKRGKALEFNGNRGSGISSYVDSGNSSAFNFSQSGSRFSIGGWIKLNSSPIDLELAALLSKWLGTGNNLSYLLGVDANNKVVLSLSEFGGSASMTLVTNNAINLNQWYYIVATADVGSDTYKIYVNGSEQTTTGSVVLANIWGSTANINIGASKDGTEDMLDGQIDEVRVYNRALSSTEIANLYQSSSKVMNVNSSQNNRLTDGLVGLWSFDGPDISGVNAYDRSGNNNTGTITGATPTIGKVGQALSFDGSSNQSVSVGSSDIACVSGSPMTISAWIYPRSLGENSGGRIFSRRTTADAYDCTLQFISGGSPNGIQFAWTGDTSLLRRSLSNPLTLNAWQQVLVTWDGSLTASNIHIYINGSELSYSTTTNGINLDSTANQPSLIGKRASNDRDFDGAIDEVRVYNRVLSAAEIQELYNMGR